MYRKLIYEFSDLHKCFLVCQKFGWNPMLIILIIYPFWLLRVWLKWYEGAGRKTWVDIISLAARLPHKTRASATLCLFLKMFKSVCLPVSLLISLFVCQWHHFWWLNPRLCWLNFSTFFCEVLIKSEISWVFVFMVGLYQHAHATSIPMWLGKTGI